MAAKSEPFSPAISDDFSWVETSEQERWVEQTLALLEEREGLERSPHIDFIPESLLRSPSPSFREASPGVAHASPLRYVPPQEEIVPPSVASPLAAPPLADTSTDSEPSFSQLVLAEDRACPTSLCVSSLAEIEDANLPKYFKSFLQSLLSGVLCWVTDEHYRRRFWGFLTKAVQEQFPNGFAGFECFEIVDQQSFFQGDSPPEAAFRRNSNNWYFHTIPRSNRMVYFVHPESPGFGLLRSNSTLMEIEEYAKISYRPRSKKNEASASASVAPLLPPPMPDTAPSNAELQHEVMVLRAENERLRQRLAELDGS